MGEDVMRMLSESIQNYFPNIDIGRVPKGRKRRPMEDEEMQQFCQVAGIKIQSHRKRVEQAKMKKYEKEQKRQEKKAKALAQYEEQLKNRATVDDDALVEKEMAKRAEHCISKFS